MLYQIDPWRNIDWFSTEENIKKQIEKYLSYGANINEQVGFLGTVLNEAVFLRTYKVAQMLLENKADPNIADCSGSTALHYAVCGKSRQMIEKLIFYGANINAKDKYGMTPLHLAVKGDDMDLVAFLVKKGAEWTPIKQDCIDKAFVAKPIRLVGEKESPKERSKKAAKLMVIGKKYGHQARRIVADIMKQKTR